MPERGYDGNRAWGIKAVIQKKNERCGRLEPKWAERGTPEANSLLGLQGKIKCGRDIRKTDSLKVKK
jgi:hypothetical protein